MDEVTAEAAILVAEPSLSTAAQDYPMGSDSRSGEPKSAASPASNVQQWSLSRIDIRSPVAPNSWPVARVELEHPKRGRVTDIAKAPGAFDAAFLAASQIVGVSPTLLSYNVRSAEPEVDQSLEITVDIEIQLDGQRTLGSATGQDLVRCSLAAWLEAIANAQSAA